MRFDAHLYSLHGSRWRGAANSVRRAYSWRALDCEKDEPVLPVAMCFHASRTAVTSALASPMSKNHQGGFIGSNHVSVGCIRGCCVPPKKGGRKRAVPPQCEVRLKMATADFAIMRLTC